jgi:hypothetical protein
MKPSTGCLGFRPGLPFEAVPPFFFSVAFTALKWLGVSSIPNYFLMHAVPSCGPSKLAASACRTASDLETASGFAAAFGAAFGSGFRAGGSDFP